MSKQSEKSNEEVSVKKNLAEAKEAEIAIDQKAIAIALEELTVKRKFIEIEKIEAQSLADSAQIELDKAMPALRKANEAVEGLESKYIAEMKSINKPLPAVSNVMEAVMIYLGEAGDWMNIKKVISKPQFKKDLFEFDKDNVSDIKMKKVQKFTKMEDFNY